MNNVGKKLIWGPWRIPGAFGVFMNITSVSYLTLAIFWGFWPPDSAVMVNNMNYNIVVFGGVLLLAVLYYLTYARTKYTGPIVEVERNI